MNIGRLLKAENKWTDRQGNEKSSDVLDIRTSNFRKRYTVSVNIKKHKTGVVKPSEVNHENLNKPDWHIWWNPSNKGESLPSEIVGSLKLKKKEETGLVYQSGQINDPSFDNGVMWISVFIVDDKNKKTKENHHGNIAWSPPQRQTMSQNQNYNQPMAQPTYEMEVQDANGNVVHSSTQTNEHAQQNQMPQQEPNHEIPF